MSDEQSRPRYGEYAPGHTPGSEPAPPPPAASATPWVSAEPSAYTPTVKKRNTADVVVTIVLLVLGLLGTLLAAFYAALFSDPRMLDEALRAQGRDGFSGSVGAGPTIIVISHVVLYLLAVGLSILSLVKRRITFWIPLVIGVIAAFIFWGTLIGILLSDPSFSQQPGL